MTSLHPLFPRIVFPITNQVAVRICHTASAEPYSRNNCRKKRSVPKESERPPPVTETSACGENAYRFKSLYVSHDDIQFKHYQPPYPNCSTRPRRACTRCRTIRVGVALHAFPPRTSSVPFGILNPWLSPIFICKEIVCLADKCTVAQSSRCLQRLYCRFIIGLLLPVDPFAICTLELVAPPFMSKTHMVITGSLAFPHCCGNRFGTVGVLNLVVILISAYIQIFKFHNVNFMTSAICFHPIDIFVIFSA